MPPRRLYFGMFLGCGKAFLRNSRLDLPRESLFRNLIVSLPAVAVLRTLVLRTMAHSMGLSGCSVALVGHLPANGPYDNKCDHMAVPSDPASEASGAAFAAGAGSGAGSGDVPSEPGSGGSGWGLNSVSRSDSTSAERIAA